MALLLETALGDIVIDLDYEGSPALTRNVLQLAKAKAYTRNLIYKVLPQRFCMTGCPVGDGSGGTSIQGLLKGSMTALSTATSRLLSPLELQEKGRVAVQGHSMGSQFLITIDQGKDHSLDGIEGDFYSIGVVAEDDDHVLDKINAAYLDPNNRPFADIRILSALVVYDPFEKDHSAELLEYIRQCPTASPERPPQETVEKRISIADIDMDDNDDDNSSVDERKQKMLHEEELQREAQSRAVVLEMLGDLPSADMKAPENVLFICKLNPVTTDEDLELIFSRFDQAVKVEIIRDHDTGDSLQYAFAEFTTPKQAQEAYFKMNHALVDDRRILVDFSQSVAKLWDKYHQKMKFSHRADTYQSHTRQPNDRRHSNNNHGHGDDPHQGRNRNERRDRNQDALNSQQRSNDRHFREPSDGRYSNLRIQDDRERDRYRTDEDSYGRRRNHRDDDRTHRRHNDHSEEHHRKVSSHRRDRGDDMKRHREEHESSDDDDRTRDRDDNHRHKREWGESRDRSRKRSRKDEERRHRSDSQKRRHKSSRHDEERSRSKERGDYKDRAHKRHRDDRENHRKDHDEKHHSRYRDEVRSFERGSVRRRDEVNGRHSRDHGDERNNREKVSSRDDTSKKRQEISGGGISW